MGNNPYQKPPGDQQTEVHPLSKHNTGFRATPVPKPNVFQNKTYSNFTAQLKKNKRDY